MHLYHPPMDARGLLGGLGLERLLAVEYNARDNEWEFVMVITGGLKFVRGRPVGRIILALGGYPPMRNGGLGNSECG